MAACVVANAMSIKAIILGGLGGGVGDLVTRGLGVAVADESARGCVAVDDEAIFGIEMNDCALHVVASSDSASFFQRTSNII